MNGVPDFKPTPVALCTVCGKVNPKGLQACRECGEPTIEKVRLGADLVDPKCKCLDKYRAAGEL